MALTDILLNEFLKVYAFLILLAVDKEFGQVPNLFDNKLRALRSEHLDVPEIFEQIPVLFQGVFSINPL